MQAASIFDPSQLSIFEFCCAERKPEQNQGSDEEGYLNSYDTKRKALRSRLLAGFTEIEINLGLKEIPSIDITEKICLSSEKTYIETKKLGDLFANYKEYDEIKINEKYLREYLLHEFFFYQKDKSELYKTLIFCCLLCGGSEIDKSGILYNLMENTVEQQVRNQDTKFMNVLENLVLIPTVITGDMVSVFRSFSSELERDEFNEIIKLYTTNCNMVKEFAIHLANEILFPSIKAGNSLMRHQFIEKMEQSNFVLVKPSEIRKMFTKYVHTNKSRALLPTRPPRKK
jgi:hypothetical protein